MEKIVIQDYFDQNLLIHNSLIRPYSSNNNEVLSGGSGTLSYFDSTSVSDGTPAHSTIDLNNLVSRVQSIEPDSYFDSTDKVGTVYVYYTHQDGRQRKKLVHDSTAHNAMVSWTPNAKDGTWEKTEFKVFDKDGAITFVDQTHIGNSEDLTHSGGTTTLNII